MPSIPEHILAQIPTLAAEGLPVEQIAFLLRLQPAIVEAELRKHENAEGKSAKTRQLDDN